MAPLPKDHVAMGSLYRVKGSLFVLLMIFLNELNELPSSDPTFLVIILLISLASTPRKQNRTEKKKMNPKNKYFCAKEISGYKRGLRLLEIISLIQQILHEHLRCALHLL